MSSSSEILLSKLNWILLLVLALACLSPTLVRTQMPGCYFQEVNLVPCLTQPSANTTEACCIALNQALSAGHRCLCAMLDSANLQLASTNPLLTPPLLLAFPGCFLSSPSLAACRAPLQQLNSPPAANTKPAPVTIAPAPNSTHATETQFAKAVPKTSKHIVPVLSFESRDGSSGRRQERGGGSYAASLCLAAICAWILYTRDEDL